MDCGQEGADVFLAPLFILVGAKRLLVFILEGGKEGRTVGSSSSGLAMGFWKATTQAPIVCTTSLASGASHSVSHSFGERGRVSCQMGIVAV